MEQENKDLCKTCEHYWLDFPMPLDNYVAHCEIIDNKYGMFTAGEEHKMDEIVPYPCTKCPFDCYSKK